MDHDRHALDWLYGGNFHGLFGAGAATVLVFVALVAGFPLPLDSHPIVLLALALGIGFSAGRLAGRALMGGSARTAQQVYMPNAAGTYVAQHSNIDALEARGDFRGAAGAWDAVAIAQPQNAWAFIRAGELYMRSLGEPATALDRFRVARDVAGVSAEHRMYASQKIIDLYLGPLADPGRGLVELRRFAETHAGTREAAHALEALSRLKAGQPTRP